jgi:hypothetical protein
MKMTEQDKYKNNLINFLEKFNNYVDMVLGQIYYNSQDKTNTRTWLQRKTSLISKMVIETNIRSSYTIEKTSVDFHGVLTYTLQDENHEKILWLKLKDHVISVINESIGNIENDTIPVHEIKPRIPIKDETLNRRCVNLINTGTPYDTVIREATLIYEERIRNKVTHDQLSELIPNSADQTGEKLAAKLLSVNKPIIKISDDLNKREAFLKITRGIFSYWRNPFHHYLDDKTESSLAWSVLGIIDSLLREIDESAVIEENISVLEKDK